MKKGIFSFCCATSPGESLKDASELAWEHSQNPENPMGATLLKVTFPGFKG